MKTEATIRLAQMSLQNGQTPEEECNAAMGAAGAKGVTHQIHLCAPLHSQAMNDAAFQAAEWQKSEDFGDYYDNVAVMMAIRYQLAHGKETEGLTRVCHLLEFINQNGDEKSVTYLVPEIEAVITQYCYWR